jgi:hypothetical protein
LPRKKAAGYEKFFSSSRALVDKKNNPSLFIKAGEIIGYLRDYKLFKKDFTARS